MFEQTIDFEKLSVEEAKRDYPALWFTYRQYFSELSDEQIAIAVSVAVGTCPHCWEYPRGCKCWNDE